MLNNKLFIISRRFVLTATIIAIIIFVSLLITTTVNAATLSITPSKSSFQISDIFTVEIILDTEESATDGVDIRYLNFDPALLEVQEIQPGTLYSSTQLNRFDNAEGTINFSQVTAGGNSFTGSGTLATITFKALAKGKAELSFDFTDGGTTDTNVASAGVDVLTAAAGGSYRVGSGIGFITRIGDFFRNLFSFLF
jgi:hypothetical protein